MSTRSRIRIEAEIRALESLIHNHEREDITARREALAALQAELAAIPPVPNPEEKKAALEKISRLTSEAMALVRQAEQIADQAQVWFDFKLDYGVGGTYNGNNNSRGYAGDGPGWTSSSERC